MNYYIDFIPNISFLEKIDKIVLSNKKDNNIIFNVYIKQLPSMNINQLIYCDIKDCAKLIAEIKDRNYKVNIMFDTFCFGNKEFTENGREILQTLDQILRLDIDFVTITNHFFLQYIKSRYKKCKIIISEYAQITNVQKICRYLEDIKADCVKIDVKLSKNLETLEYIKNNFDINRIHIDTNKLYYDNDIYQDSLNNSIAHYIQEEKWEEISLAMQEYEKEQKKLNNKKLHLTKEEIERLKEMGYDNFWIYCNLNEEQYINDMTRIIL